MDMSTRKNRLTNQRTSLRTTASSAVKIVTYLMRQHEACLLNFPLLDSRLSGGAARPSPAVKTI